MCISEHPILSQINLQPPQNTAHMAVELTLAPHLSTVALAVPTARVTPLSTLGFRES